MTDKTREDKFVSHFGSGYNCFPVEKFPLLKNVALNIDTNRTDYEVEVTTTSIRVNVGDFTVLFSGEAKE